MMKNLVVIMLVIALYGCQFSDESQIKEIKSKPVKNQLQKDLSKWNSREQITNEAQFHSIEDKEYKKKLREKELTDEEKIIQINRRIEANGGWGKWDAENPEPVEQKRARLARQRKSRLVIHKKSGRIWLGMSLLDMYKNLPYPKESVYESKSANSICHIVDYDTKYANIKGYYGRIRLLFRDNVLVNITSYGR